ncbi:MAG: hypothetical protein ACODAQ_06140, partial [Phycisphaeraceae bacterium]
TNLVSTSYNFWVGTGSYPRPASNPLSNQWFFWQPVSASTPGDPRAPAARRTHHGQNVDAPDSSRIKYVAPAAEHPMMLDINDPDTGRSGSSAIGYLDNHDAGGQNILYADGHTMWRSDEQVSHKYRDIYY